MENVWLILGLLVIPAGYVVFELYAFNDKFKWCEHKGKLVQKKRKMKIFGTLFQNWKSK